MFILSKKTKYFVKFVFLLILFLFNPQTLIANDEKIEIQKIHQLLKDKKFKESIQSLEELSLKNNIKAQLLYSKILYSGNIIPQDFEKSYKWATASLLGGLKGSKRILKMLNNYLTQKQLDPIKDKLRDFLEKRAFINDKRAIIQIAKFYETYANPPNMVKAYSWYNIAVAKGIKSASKKRDDILEDLNEKDLLDAQKLSNTLFKQIKTKGD